VTSTYSHIHWEEEKIQNWNQKNRSLPASVSRVYEDTRLGSQTQIEHQSTMTRTLFIHCIPDCDHCNGYVLIADSGHRYKCSCIHHTLAGSKRNTR
jgi:hypothetical protein